MSEEDTVKYVKPYTTLVVGIIIGRFVWPKVQGMVGK